VGGGTAFEKGPRERAAGGAVTVPPNARRAYWFGGVYDRVSLRWLSLFTSASAVATVSFVLSLLADLTMQRDDSPTLAGEGTAGSPTASFASMATVQVVLTTAGLSAAHHSLDAASVGAGVHRLRACVVAASLPITQALCLPTTLLFLRHEPPLDVSFVAWPLATTALSLAGATAAWSATRSGLPSHGHFRRGQAALAGWAAMLVLGLCILVLRG